MSDADEIRAVIDRIAETFSKLDVKGWLANFHAPRMFVLPHTTITPADADEAERLFGPLLESLRARGFTRTREDEFRVKLLTPTTAIASVAFTRLAGDETLERLGATYLLQKRDGRWGVVVVTSHGPDVSVLRE